MRCEPPSPPGSLSFASIIRLPLSPRASPLPIPNHGHHLKPLLLTIALRHMDRRVVQALALDRRDPLPQRLDRSHHLLQPSFVLNRQSTLQVSLTICSVARARGWCVSLPYERGPRALSTTSRREESTQNPRGIRRERGKKDLRDIHMRVTPTTNLASGYG